MIVKVYAYRDIQVGAFEKPIYDTNEIEVFKVLIARLVGTMSKDDIVKGHVRDKELYYLGEFDDVSGVIKSAPEFLLRLSDYIKEVPDYGDEQSVQERSEQAA